jgi:hypothetical protein
MKFFRKILFGRKVFEVNGYTNDICKFLKLHFRLRTNKDLFNFLGYESVRLSLILET